MDSKLITLKKNGQITLPIKIREAVSLTENDQLAITIKDGQIILQPVITIPKDQAWFWTKEWQEEELEAEHDIKTGNIKTFRNAEELIADLRSEE
ncbi:hypothetical protein BBH88_04505 [Planococcus antarcticus DSM 14505]|uniref:SpoVT-AbrB domain-containing protein n=1 Tax=Planococcus antarcticus DSM 14505 TaxID=1185653 RepID=A0ABM6D262_9BACL|nr:AbrB/MazE/SpoVT family DNA-binding domain-containing protein [Planococcus antarcticus]ANU09609.1 hypothetical protein BBH88_04505 [Planococcus antarcticus DSM 14505]